MGKKFVLFIGFLGVCFFLFEANVLALSFNDAVGYDVGSQPYSVAVRDFNGDGTPDLAVANSSSDTISILLGNGDGIFQAAPDCSVGYGLFSVAVGDFNGDGKPDLAVANYYSYKVFILLGKGDGTFQTPIYYSVGYFPYSVAVEDFNGDTKLDLAVANYNSDTVSILLGNGDGSFQEPVDYNAGIGPCSVAVGDFNVDTKPDLAVANQGSDTVSILLGNGDGSFQEPVDYSVGYYPYSVAVGDFNVDGNPDLAVTIYNSDPVSTVSTVSILLGNGDGAFHVARPYNVGTFPRSVAVGDFNGDGKPDLAVANYNSDAVSILAGNGDGSFRAEVDYSAGSGPCSVAVGDFNVDGKPDLAVANLYTDTVSILLNTTTLGMEHTLTVNITPSGGGTVTGTNISCPGICSGTYDNNTEVTLIVDANTGYTFAGWIGCDFAYDNDMSCDVTMDDDKVVTATFTPPQTFNIRATTNSGGSISPSGKQTVNYGDSLIFTVTPDAGYEVKDVKVNGKSEGPLTQYKFDDVSFNQIIAVKFKAKTFTITTTAGSFGKITPGTRTVKGGTNKTFTLKPDKGHHVSEVKLDDVVIFDGTNISDSNLWKSGRSNVYKYSFKNITDNHSVEAGFEIDMFHLTVSNTGTGTGTVSSDVEGISCGDDCDEIYDYNTMVTLTATEDEDSVFEGWSGSCKGKKLTCKLKMTKAANVAAKFTKTYKLTVNKQGTGDGTVTSLPRGIKCDTNDTDCEERYKDDTMVKLTAKPAKDSAFVEWSGCTTTDGTKCIVQMIQDTPVTAIFELK